MSEPHTGAEKRALKSEAQLLEAVVRVGQAGVTDAVISSLDVALEQHGLVKVRFADFKEERRTLAPQLAEATRSFLIQQVGNVAVFFRRKALAQSPV
jgi:RNA-binding protein